VQSGPECTKRNVHAFLTHVGGGSPPGSHVARARTETSIPGFRWGILAGYLWKLNPPVYQSLGETPAFSTSIEYLTAYLDNHRLSSVSSFRAVRRAFSLSLLTILQPLAVFPPRFPDPVLDSIRPLSYEFRLNESLRRFHRFPPVIRVRCILLQTSRSKWSGEFIAYFRRFVPIIRRLDGKCFINLALSRRRRGIIVLDKVTKLICTATRRIILYRIVLYTYSCSLLRRRSLSICTPHLKPSTKVTSIRDTQKFSITFSGLRRSKFADFDRV